MALRSIAPGNSDGERVGGGSWLFTVGTLFFPGWLGAGVERGVENIALTGPRGPANNPTHQRYMGSRDPRIHIPLLPTGQRVRDRDRETERDGQRDFDFSFNLRRR